MDSGHLREKDADLMLRVIEESLRDPQGPAMPDALLIGLQELVPCDHGVSYQHHRPGAHECRVIHWADPGGPTGVEWPGRSPAAEPLWQLWPTAMCSWPQRAGDLRTVIHSDDFYPTDRAWRADPLSEVMSEVRYSMIVSLPAPRSEARRLCFQRSADPAFTERDRQVVALLRPHLQEIWLAAEQRRRGVPDLTPREWEVLELAAAGFAFAEIAAQLYVSVGTVRKHMEHVRERLGVHSVAAAAAIALPRPPAQRSRR
ncbi:helix-turn-helix transcriptional regulator [Petropleomorpha daqingensis]|uniref:DNA-binding CsgD family transcriptional regulator n=1 Tax=Petropleomorpha daqingensis TaxID=2026353 RepID=A0A853CKK0_9ACTN|nr:LuxR family transcriptional regulator [Petropleomorpha daqingensis]NYJ07389.1 DNA-binding CsgD family transcriptional regulator [Petropleomorpha daqingensis]